MRRRRPPELSLSVTAPPVLRAGADTVVEVTLDGDAEVAVFLRLLGWDMRSPQRFPLATATGSGPVSVTLPTGLPPGCARMTEYAVYAEARPPGGRLAAAATPVAVIGDTFPDPDAEQVPRGGTVRGRVAGGSERVEIGAELRVAHEIPRFLAVAEATPAADGSYAATLPEDVPPSLFDGEDLTIGWVVRAGEVSRPITVTDPTGAASERRPALLTFLAQLSRDPFALR